MFRLALASEPVWGSRWPEQSSSWCVHTFQKFVDPRRLPPEVRLLHRPLSAAHDATRQRSRNPQSPEKLQNDCEEAEDCVNFSDCEINSDRFP